MVVLLASLIDSVSILLVGLFLMILCAMSRLIIIATPPALVFVGRSRLYVL
jgi:hypothetical protein